MLRYLKSSIGRKQIVAVTGLLLIGFLVSHVSGNALLLARDGGASYNAYAAKIQSFGPLLWVARTGLVLLFALHIPLALRLSAENRRARGQRPRPARHAVQRRLPAPFMLLTGITVMSFLIAHLWQFTFDHRFVEEGAGLVKETFAHRGVTALYTLGILSLWIHLWHATPAALQTLGLRHPRWDRFAQASGRAVVSVVHGLFLAILWTTHLAG